MRQTARQFETWSAIGCIDFREVPLLCHLNMDRVAWIGAPQAHTLATIDPAGWTVSCKQRRKGDQRIREQSNHWYNLKERCNEERLHSRREEEERERERETSFPLAASCAQGVKQAVEGKSALESHAGNWITEEERASTYPWRTKCTQVSMILAEKSLSSSVYSACLVNGTPNTNGISSKWTTPIHLPHLLLDGRCVNK